MGAECLFVYFVALLLLFCMLLWSAMMCFFFQGAAARDLEHFVDREWAAFAEVAQLQAREIEVLRAIENRDHLVVGGSVCTVSHVQECTTVEWTDCVETVVSECQEVTVRMPEQTRNHLLRCTVDH